ncbi:hypothetical protein [Roseomonas xinghualingensis]|uniref:hypothetical protein n=1 Tax=Roseomonas xinghualingensis TaxID=2986475 RepID=UPI0021F1D2D9|nr:hypothetical protein [Roseomonas sp. SXEYE001]MCV4207538.1 hypothetical protein [Roseomonas sp. SXEYE001]
MLRGIKPPVSVQRRAGLQREQLKVKVVWDGQVPAEHRDAFAHKLRTPVGREVVARWIEEPLYAAGGGHWWVEGRESALSAGRLSGVGYAYVAPLREGPSASPNAEAVLEQVQGVS